MKDPVKQATFYFSVASVISGVIGWLFMTFATVKYVDARYDSVEKRLEIIDERTWNMNGRQDPPPLHIQQRSPARTGK